MQKILSLGALALLLALPASAAPGPLDGKVIALDAGHGAGETGAVGKCGIESVIEADVNLAVRAKLTALIEAAGGEAHPVAQLSSRQDRVADAEAANADVLISIHHNGSSSATTDYTKSFVTQKNDKEFAQFIHPELVGALGLPDNGIKNDGYGMTVYGSLPGILTEAYFITSTEGACDYLDYLDGIAGTRVEREAQALYNGLVAYFGDADGGDDGGNGNKGGNGKGKNK